MIISKESIYMAVPDNIINITVLRPAMRGSGKSLDERRCEKNKDH